MELKLKLKIKEVEVELTMEDVKKLKELLEGLCETKVIKEYLPHYWHWYDWWYQPELHDKWYVQCGANSASTVKNNSYTAALSDNITFTLNK
jgi:hypothetical protein